MLTELETPRFSYVGKQQNITWVKCEAGNNDALEEAADATQVRPAKLEYYYP